MPVTVVRFNLVAPGATPAELSARYRAALEMAAYADEHGVTTVQTEEHHGVDNNWLPSPFAFAAAVFGATERIAVTVSAVIGPLHDPLRLAEEVAVLDLISGGRLVTVAGIGYRPEEYALFDVDWKRRGRLQDELLETLLKAWTGEPFEYRGRTVRITPRPFTEPHPLLLVGGSSKAAARRAARLGLPFFPSAHLPQLEAYYKERLTEYGTEGWTMMPAAETPLLHVTEDPDRAWAEYGGHFLHEARTYASWQSGDIRSAVRSAATTVEELRAEGVYRIVTPDECVALGLDNLVLHPLAGGMPENEGWRSLRLFCEDVLPRLT
ncbi:MULTISPECIES: LLM class flavin-dependent oxidoreductase [unclassified Streptomyces]|uniref:LLM class flavin-dependent oxidoreductase n=1 Tax=unclassified Streptomyces TaxID=2593676 RepID=UPI0007F3324C|nr:MULTISPECIES: LLM class flavin-dependent oxidoreductase [unclassified Streptomyces]MCM1975891.1 LLM class flavin-dependent oxidoreductase [Streptomyces sp. G1]SBT92632.1 Flavin-dependent oxidoreductase, luciferase family (includes alkanesulfonate monooxygenase SsuD and methylene tetrahydromethanopterin reductase) [Streptomyces sp. DI166]